MARDWAYVQYMTESAVKVALEKGLLEMWKKGPIVRSKGEAEALGLVWNSNLTVTMRGEVLVAEQFQKPAVAGVPLLNAKEIEQKLKAHRVAQQQSNT